MSLEKQLLDSYKKRFLSYKELGEKAIDRLGDEQTVWRPDPASNSIAVIVKHMSGNMLSRFTDFLTSDGEKPWRERDTEFEEEHCPKPQLMEKWDKGWTCFFQALNDLSEEDLHRTIIIRGQALSVTDALNRQLSHYAYHVGQIIYIAKMLKGKDWESLSIPPGGSSDFNDRMTGRS